jgi:hypothetical protein|tara:strand:- start:975 stop:1154 length:180 start_codon:yes stop_codon:yes gene_type:complete
MGDIIMGVIILFGILIGVFGFMLIEDQLVHKDYPIIDQYWLSGLILIGFVASMMAMMMV